MCVRDKITIWAIIGRINVYSRETKSFKEKQDSIYVLRLNVRFPVPSNFVHTIIKSHAT